MSGTTPTTTSRPSSSNRSTRSAFRHPPWTSSSLANKNSPTASLSIIIAEPEQGAPLKSAADSVAPLASSVENEEPLLVGDRSRAARRSSLELPLSARTQTWFSSLSRKDSKKAAIAVTEPTFSVPSSSLPPYSPRQEVITVKPGLVEPLTKSEPLSIHTQTQQSWLSHSSSSSSGSPPPFASTIPRTPPSIIPSPQDSPTKTSNNIPPASPPPVSHSPSVNNLPTVPSSLSPHKGTSAPKNSALEPTTPSSSRFTLSIPLLGRPKVPLDSVMGLGESKKTQVPVVALPDSSRDSRQVVPFLESSIAPSSSSPPPPPSTSPPIQPTSLNHSLGPNATITPVVHNPQYGPSNPEAEITSTTNTFATATAPATALDPSGPNHIHSNKPIESTSWWSYVGWNSTSTPIPGPPVLVSIEAPVANEESKSTTEISTSTTHLTPSDVSAVPGSAENGLVEDNKGTEPIIEGAKAEEAQSDDQQREQQPLVSSPSVWYAPWGWYSSSTNVNRPVQSEPQGLGISENVVPLPMTQDPEPEPISSEVPAAPPINPITASMEANWGGWASFFSSRTLMVKTLGYKTVGAGGEDVKRDEDGMEVMDIDDDDDDEEEEQKVGGETDILKDSGRPHGQVSSSSGATPPVIAKTGPLLLKTSNSDSSRHEPDGTSNLSQPVPKHPKRSVPSTPKKSRSGTNTPYSLPASPTPEKNQNPSLPSTPTTSNKKIVIERTTSPAPSKKSISGPPPPPNLVLPTWQQMFYTAPRNVVPPVMVKPLGDQGVGGKLLGKTMRFVSDVLFTKDAPSGRQVKGKERERSRDSSEVFVDEGEVNKKERVREFGKELPKTWQIIEDAGLDATTPTTPMIHIPAFGFCSSAGASGVVDGGGANPEGMKDVLRGCKKVVVIGIHGWFPGPMLRSVVGGPTGTSTKFANMTELALHQFESEHGVELEKITKIPLEGDGTIDVRVERFYNNLTTNDNWLNDIHEADAIIVSTHSQGSIVSTHLLNRLIQDNHITTARHHYTITGAESFPSAIGILPRRKVQRVCCLALCGIHLGPLRYLSSSTLGGTYIQYFESTAARELFEFQNTESAVSKAYVKALQNVLDHGIKMLYVASLNDQVVPLYSGLFTAVSHPLILRALYIDGDAYHSSDFLSNLLVLLLRILNSGISDSGLIAHLSEATAGSLNGVGHSTAYEELTTFSLAVKYLFLANEGTLESTELHVESFNASQEQNDYEIPWSLRDIIADERVSHFFSRDIAELKDAFREWHPKTSILRDLKRKLQPITRLPNSTAYGSSASKL